jgi:hypothetical protein
MAKYPLLLAFLFLVIAFDYLWGPRFPAPRLGHGTYPDVIIDVRDASLDSYGPAWERELGRRFHNSVAILCHGGNVVQGEWLVQNDPDGGYAHTVCTVQQMIVAEQREYPGRTVILLCCNPDHEVLHGYPNVYYAPSSVWCIPDRECPPNTGEGRMTTQQVRGRGGYYDVESQSRWGEDPDDVGNAFEFISAE